MEPMLKCGLFHQASSSFFPLPLPLPFGSLCTSEPIGERSAKISKGSQVVEGSDCFVPRHASRTVRANADEVFVLFLGQTSHEHLDRKGFDLFGLGELLVEIKEKRQWQCGQCLSKTIEERYLCVEIRRQRSCGAESPSSPPLSLSPFHSSTKLSRHPHSRHEKWYRASRPS